MCHQHHHDIISGSGVPGRVEPVPLEERRQWIQRYLLEKQPGIKQKSFHMMEGFLDIYFYPMKWPYFFKVVLQGLSKQFDEWRSKALLSGIHYNHLKSDEFLYFLRVYWDFLEKFSEFVDRWPEGEIICWATSSERDEVLSTTMIRPMPTQGMDGEFFIIHGPGWDNPPEKSDG